MCRPPESTLTYTLFPYAPLFRTPRQLPPPTELRAAADRLVSALAAHSDPEYRLTVLKRLVRRLGEERYPLFLRLLGVVAESDDARAQRLLAETFGTAL